MRVSTVSRVECGEELIGYVHGCCPQMFNQPLVGEMGLVSRNHGG